MLSVLFVFLFFISSVLAACNLGEFPCGTGCMPQGSVCCDSKTHYCATRETCSISNGTAYCTQGCVVGSAQGSQECGNGCVQLGRACCGSSATKFWTCDQGGKCDTANSGCLAFGTNAQEAGMEIGSKATKPANPVRNDQAPPSQTSGSNPIPSISNSGSEGGNNNSGNSNSGSSNSETIGIIMIVIVATVDSLVSLFLGFMCFGYKSRVSKIEKVLPKPLMQTGPQANSTSIPMYPPNAYY
ncbi:hypothetical protein BJ742DRAFT_774891 [Cladochytrium replicatum]|nr:hypothetical protein BJ742DRAFT_774891 [Cladochytrium replicatum]